MYYYVGLDVCHNQSIAMSWKVTATWMVYHQTIKIPLSDAQCNKTFYSSEVQLSVVDDYDNISRMNGCTTDSEGT